MWPQRIHPSQISRVSLRVRDLKQSMAFYCEIFGLEPRSCTTPAGCVCVCSTPSPNGRSVFAISLIQGLPRGVDPVGMDHLSLEVSNANDLEDIYALALARGAQATKPRISGGEYQVYVFDPDGYKIELVAATPPEKNNKHASQQQRKERESRGSDSGDLPAARVSIPKEEASNKSCP